MEKQKHYKIVSYEGKNNENGKTIAEFWWDGKKVRCSNENMLNLISKKFPDHHPSDGEDFLDWLPHIYKGPYQVAVKVK